MIFNLLKETAILNLKKKLIEKLTYFILNVFDNKKSSFLDDYTEKVRPFQVDYIKIVTHFTLTT